MDSGSSFVGRTAELALLSAYGRGEFGRGTRRRASEAVYRGLLPYPDLFICGGAGLTMIDGSVHRYLGLAALGLGQADDAVRQLRSAVSVNAREGLLACEALATLDLARALEWRGRSGDAAEACGGRAHVFRTRVPWPNVTAGTAGGGAGAETEAVRDHDGRDRCGRIVVDGT
jgi:hypothetical protein